MGTAQQVVSATLCFPLFSSAAPSFFVFPPLHLVSPWAAVPSRVHLLQHRLTCGRRFLCCGASPSALAFCFPLVPLSSFFPYFLPFLKYIFTKVPPGWLMDSPASCGGSTVELAGTCCAEHRAAPGLVSQRPSLKPPSTKTLPRAPGTTSTCKKQTQDLKHWNKALVIVNRKHRG